MFDGVVETVALARNDDAGANRSSQVEGDTRYFEAKIKLDTGGRTIPTGLAADADIETKSHRGLKVPSQAVLGRPVEGLSADARTTQAGSGYQQIRHHRRLRFQGRQGRRHAYPVKVGPSDETHTLILSGIKEGDPVIAGPFKVLETLADGQVLQKETSATTRPATQPTVLAAGDKK